MIVPFNRTHKIRPLLYNAEAVDSKLRREVSLGTYVPILEMRFIINQQLKRTLNEDS
jgi:hypothetical protein